MHVAVYAQLLQCFPAQAPPSTDGVIALLTEVLVEEGLLNEKSPEKAQSGEARGRACDEGSTNAEEMQLQQDYDEEKNLSVPVEDNSAKTIRILQHSLEKLMDENDKVPPELYANTGSSPYGGRCASF